MTTKRKRSQATSRDGINFVRTLVERHNCTFQEIDLQNDLGNDAYVEFVAEESATGCCVALQIKSGSSYRAAGGRYGFQSDSDHFEYWASHTLPVLAIIVDPEASTAAWVDITDHLRRNPAAVNAGPFSIYADQDFSESSFADFRQHCLAYRDQYSRKQNFGRALDAFADRADDERCFDGLRALFAFHRQQVATWYYLISCLSNFQGHRVLRPLVARLCHIPAHGDIFWSRQNIIEEEVRQEALRLMRQLFDRRDALTMLSVIDDAGIDRGTIGQAVHALVDTMANVPALMESIAIDQSQSERVRHSAILFATSSAQWQSPAGALDLLDRIRASMASDDELRAVVDWLAGDLKQYGRVSFY
jgi:hypothetical protein